MKSNYLLSNKYKIPGWILLILGLIAGVFLMLSEPGQRMVYANY